MVKEKSASIKSAKYKLAQSRRQKERREWGKALSVSEKVKQKDWADRFIEFFEKHQDLQRVKEVGEIIRNVIESYENFFHEKERASFNNTANVKQAREKLRKALTPLNQLPTKFVRYSIDFAPVSNPIGEIKKQAMADMLDEGTIAYYGNRELAEDITIQIENFKSTLSMWEERLPVGVCRYHRCHRPFGFFLKKRKDERYCSPTHKKLAWQEIRRKAKRKASPSN